MLNQGPLYLFVFLKKKYPIRQLHENSFALNYLCFKKYLLKQVSSYEKNIPYTHFNATYI
jgi:hypothetical protein